MTKVQRLSTTDGLDLFTRHWPVPDPRGAVVIVHGMADHSGRFQWLAESLNAHQWSVFACDLRGHGESPDPPGSGRIHIDAFDDYLQDVGTLMRQVKGMHPDLPVVLIGHSMGGLIALLYTLENPDDLTATVLSSPALRAHPDSAPGSLLTAIARLLSRLKPNLLFPSNLDTKAVSRDPNVVEAYENDPLVSSKASARFFTELTSAMERAFSDAGKLQTPLLMMQSGSDRLVDPDAAAEWVSAAPPGHVHFRVWEGLYHEMFNEPEKERVVRFMQKWLDKTCKC